MSDLLFVGFKVKAGKTTIEDIEKGFSQKIVPDLQEYKDDRNPEIPYDDAPSWSIVDVRVQKVDDEFTIGLFIEAPWVVHITAAEEEEEGEYDFRSCISGFKASF